MIKIELSQEAREALRYWRFHYPDPRGHVRMEALYLRSHGMTTRDITRLCGISQASFHRYLEAYVAGGIEKLKAIDHDRPHSELVNHRTPLDASFREHPPATVAEAAAKIKALTGIERKPTQVRQCLKSLGMQPRNVGMIPAKADVTVQEEFTKKVWSPGETMPKPEHGWSSLWMPPTLCSLHF